MVNLFSVIMVAIIFVIILVVFSTEKLDYLTFALLGSIIAALILAFTAPPEKTIEFSNIMGMIEFEPLIFIFGMQIFIAVAEQRKIFQYIAIKSIQLTKGNDRVLFYFICTISTLTAAVIADVTVSIIFIPLIIRVCKILEIEAAPFLFGITICINIGSLITPFSSSENIIIAAHFADYGVNTIWFMKNLVLFGLVLLFLTLFLLDKLMLKRNKRVDPIRVVLVQEVLTPSIVLENKKEFYLNTTVLVIVFTLFFFISQAYLIAILGAIIIILVNKEKISNYFKFIEWEIIFFFASLYIVVGVMIENGTIEILGNWINSILPSNPLAIALFILLGTSLMSAFLANSPTAIIFLAITDALIVLNPSIGANPDPLIIAILIGINLGGNFLPQGAACDVMTLTIAKRYNINGFTFKTLTKYGSMFATFHLVSGIVFLSFYYLVFY